MKCNICKSVVNQPVRVSGISRCPWCGNELDVDGIVHEIFEEVATEVPQNSLTEVIIRQAGGDPDDECWKDVVGEIVEEQKWLWIEKHLGVDTKIKYIEGYITWEECVIKVVKHAKAEDD